jgi:protoporphyrinogen oxidase
LTAAYLLAKQGFRVTVLEADTVVGGLSRTAQYKGYRFDIGGHRFFTKIDPVEALWNELLGSEFISVPRLSRIYYNGKFFDYPLKAGNALLGLGPVETVRILASYVAARLRPSLPEENFQQWVSNRFGDRLFTIFFKTYTEKVWGIPTTEIRAEWAAQRIQGLSLWRAALSALPLQRRSATLKTLIHEFKYPRLGPGQMWETALDRVVELGGMVHLGRAVTAIEVEDSRVVAIRTTSPTGECRMQADHVIATMPLRHLVEALEPAPPDEVRQAAAGIHYRDFLVVALMIRQTDLFPDNWIYIHSPGVAVGRVQNFNNWSAAMVPEPGVTCLGLEYFCFEGDGMWSRSDADLVEMATREIGQLNLADPTKVFDGCVVRMPKAYPVYDSTYRAHLDTVRSHIDSIPNLHPVGRNGMHKYNNADHSMYTAMLTLENMLGARHDVWAVNTDFDYHEEQKLEPARGAEARPQ